MSIDSALLKQVIDAAKAVHLDQARLAQAARVAPETISRAKKRGTIDLSTLQALAQAVGLGLTLSGGKRSSLADPARGLAWSNPGMGDEALVRNALRKGTYQLVLEAVLEHGLPFVRQQWALMLADPDVGLSARAQADVSRKLDNIERGLQRAAA